MESFLTDFLNNHCPKKTFRSKENTPAWVTHDIIVLSKDRDRAWARAKLTDTEDDWASARRLRNWTNNAIKAAKGDYLREELNNSRTDPRKFWRNIKNVLPDQATGSINIKNPVTGVTMPRDRQAQVVNDFFANIGENLATKFRGGETPVLVHENIIDKLEIRHITQPEVLTLISKISTTKSSGMDNVSSRVLRDFLTLASREITWLYNNIIDTGIFPDKWKIATVTPIPKVTNASCPNELRPISILPVPGKLLEKYITISLENYLEDRDFFADNQNGFRKGKSTAGALSKFLDDVVGDLNESKTCIAAYLDVQKAFDTINHNILLIKLRACGIGDKLCSLLENYLSNRKQKTRLHNGLSDLKPINIGVPQGSTVGPIMFIIYINDLIKVLDNAKALMYADDTVIYCSSNCNRAVRKVMQRNLDSVEKWFQTNRLSLNVSKTKLMTFMSDHKRKRDPNFRLFMKGNKIDETEIYKYLGTHIDNRLNGDVQFNKTSQTIGLKLRTFGRVRRFLNTPAALTVYKSTILPIIDYNDHFQMLWNADKLRKLQKMQNWGLRIVYNNRNPKLDEAELHQEANLTLLKSRRVLHLLSLLYFRAKDKENLDNRPIATRQFAKIKFKVINPVIKKAFKSPNYLGAQLWDLLPRETQAEPTFQTFKFKVKGHIAAGMFKDY